jgi:TonB family protein
MDVTDVLRDRRGEPDGLQKIQEQTPPAEPPKREAVRPPAVKAPEMTVPVPSAKKQIAKTEVKQAPAEARGRTPTRGKEVTPGNSIAETGARGQGFGLSTGGGPGTGSSLEIIGDFCCPGYIATMVDRIRGAWNQNQGSRGVSFVKFTIQRDGRLTDYVVEKPSGSTPLDLAALRAVAVTKSLPPLPNEYPNPTLVVHLSFEYK